MWAATAGRWPPRIRGFDRYSHATGEMRWRLGGAIPVMSEAGDDITRSAAGRLASELILVPAAALDPAVSWHAVDEYRATADVRIGDVVDHVTIEVDDRGAVRSLWLPRWGNPDGGAFAEHPFGGELGGEATYEGVHDPDHTAGGVGIRHRRLAQRGLLPGRDRDRPVPLTARRALVTPPFCSRGGGPRSAGPRSSPTRTRSHGEHRPRARSGREPASACWPRHL